MDTKLQSLCIIKDEMLMNPSVDASLILKAYRLAEEDKYLYELMRDWMIVTDPSMKDLLMDEVVNYTQEFIRKTKIKNES